MSKLAGNTRAALVGILFAMVAFSYALATSAGLGESSVCAAGRAVGSNPLHFTNPLHASGDRDLGDAVAGSAFARYCRAAGGVAPYAFTTAGTGTSLLTTIGLSLQPTGLVGTALAKTATQPWYSFAVTVTDSFGTKPNAVTNQFRITLVSGNQFKFATGPDLGEAVQYRDYVNTLQVIGNTTPASFAITLVKLSTDTTVSALEDIGLTVSSDGTIFGKPVAAGILTFTANCTGKNGQKAMSRDGTTVGQAFTITIIANSIVSSSVFATAIQVKGGGGAGKDSIKYAALVNLAGKKVTDLSGQTLDLRIGLYTSPTSLAFDSKGKTAKPAASKTPIPNTTASVNSNAQLKAAVSKENFNTAGTAVFAAGGVKNGTMLLPVSVRVGNLAAGQETLPFTVKEKSGKYTLSYKVGAPAPAGSFFVYSVAGKDDTKGATAADSWKVGILAQPPAKTAGKSGNLTMGSFAKTASAVVSIGTGFSDDIGAVESKGKVKSTDKSVKAADQIKKLAMDSAKGKGSFQTTLCAASKTGLSEGGTAGIGKAANFMTNITLTDAAAGKGNQVYAGEGSRVIYGAKSGWTSKIPK